ncbi:MAG TPA: hypothetical protein VGI75_03535 [Pirellulales bacterium]
MLLANEGRGADQNGRANGAAATLPTSDPDAQEFKDKVISVHIQYPDKEAGHTLKDVGIRHIGGHTFLTGMGVTVGPKANPYEGRTVWVSVDRIIQIVIYKDLDEMQKAYEKYHPKDLDVNGK